MVYLGVDVAKDSLEVSNATGSRGRSFPNDGPGIQALAFWLSKSFPKQWSHLIVEPTSTYHHPLVQALADLGTNYTLINPAHTAAFAQGTGQKGQDRSGGRQAVGILGRKSAAGA